VPNGGVAEMVLNCLHALRRCAKACWTKANGERNGSGRAGAHLSSMVYCLVFEGSGLEQDFAVRRSEGGIQASSDLGETDSVCDRS
jgi:hypothetical protein